MKMLWPETKGLFKLWVLLSYCLSFPVVLTEHMCLGPLGQASGESWDAGCK